MSKYKIGQKVRVLSQGKIGSANEPEKKDMVGKICETKSWEYWRYCT